MRVINFAILALTELIIDPASLGRKVDLYLSKRKPQLMRGISLEKVLKKISTSSPKVARLEELRLYTEAFDCLGGRARINPIKNWEKYRLGKKIEQLECHISESNAIGKKEGEIRTLHYFTNSLPHTRSGYTERSGRVIDCQRESGITVFAATRYNYPLSVGVFRYAQQDNIQGMPVYRLIPKLIPLLSSRRKAKAVRQLVNLCLELKIDVLQTTTGFENAEIVSLAAEKLQIPWTYEVRGELEETWISKVPDDLQYLAQSSDYYRKARQNEEKAMASASKVISLSEVSKGSLIKRGVDSHKIEVIPNGVDGLLLKQTITKDEARKRIGLKGEKIYVGSVTSVVGYEGLDILVRALEHLPEAVCGVIVGDGEALAEIENLADSLGLTDRLVFPGRKNQSDALDWYCALDVFTVPRRNTAVCRRVTPIKATNAQALGIPVVASDLPALREVTGGYAVFVEPEEPIALAKGILTALRGDAPRAPITWLESRSWSANGNRYEHILRGF